MGEEVKTLGEELLEILDGDDAKVGLGTNTNAEGNIVLGYGLHSDAGDAFVHKGLVSTLTEDGVGSRILGSSIKTLQEEANNREQEPVEPSPYAPKAKVEEDDEEDDDDNEDPVSTASIDVPGTGSVKDGSGNIILTVKTLGDIASLEIDHSYGKNSTNGDLIPEFTLYADELNPWGDQVSEGQATEGGITATYDNDTQTFTFTIAHDGTAMYVINNQGDGVMNFYLNVKDVNGVDAYSMYDGTYVNVVTVG